VNDLLDWQRLGLKEKIGQLFICGFDGTEAHEDILGLIEEYGIGGVIYFRRNLRDAGQVAALSSRLQQASHTPLFLAIDQEGGMVVRLEEGVTVMPGAMAQGAANDERLTFEAARLSSRQLREIGINFNFAPCLDVNNNPRNPVIGVRSFGEDPGQVSRLGAAAIAGVQAGGVAAAAKHFPGHGDTDSDSHYELPVVPHDMERLEQVELPPFRRAIEDGVDAIMTAHVVFPAFEPDLLPATLSRRILTGLLREHLGYDGVIVTDCLEMNAVSETIGAARGAVQALKAGADLVLVSHRLHRQKAALEAVLEAVHAGELAEARIDEAVARVWRLKEKRGILSGIPWDSDRASADRVARELSEKAVTLVKGEDMLPLPKGSRVTVVWTEARVGTEVVEVIRQDWTLGEALSAEGYQVEEVRIGMDPTGEEAEQAHLVSEGSGTVVFVSYDAAFSDTQAQLIRKLSARTDRTFVLAAARTPYDLSAAPDVPVYLCTYENKPTMMTALAGVLSGRVVATAKLPVSIGELPRSG
jgi:beta-N-acetylhexosaminidase